MISTATDIDHRDADIMLSYYEDRIAAMKKRILELQAENALLKLEASRER